MERAAPHVTGWSAQILGFGDRDMPDAAHGIPSWTGVRHRGLWVPSARSWGWIYGYRITPRCRGAQTGVSIAQVMRQAGSVPIHLLVDSTGLKIFGEGEWLAQKHNTKGIRRRWRKLHLGTGPRQRGDCLRRSDSR